MKKTTIISLLAVAIASVGCVSKSNIGDAVKEAIKKDPKILTDAIEANPVEFTEAIQKAIQSARSEIAKKQEAEQKKQLEAYYEKPLEPQIRKDELFRGSKDGVLTLVEYSDFQCPYCTRGSQVVMDLLEKYKGKIRFVYKHLPLDFHKEARMASEYYEGIRIQSEEKAIKFHDELFANQQKIAQLKEKFLMGVAKKLKVNMKKLKKDMKSDAVQKRIDEDIAEAGKFGIRGTPGFLLNGVPVKGAYPTAHFVDIVNKLKEMKKVNL